MGYVRMLRCSAVKCMGSAFCEFRQIERLFEPSPEGDGSSGNDNYPLASQGVAKPNMGTRALVCLLIGLFNRLFG
jgi:hypothetical protein